MIDSEREGVEHQYYRTYIFRDRDIVLKEFDNAQEVAYSQSKLFQQLISLLLAGTTVLIGFVGRGEEFLQGLLVSSSSYTFFMVTTGTVLLFAVLKYFTEMHKTIVFNARKVVILRQMLGLDYGVLQLVLPNWRVEGASNPTGIKLFPGWLTLPSVPLWVVLVLLNMLYWSFFGSFIVNSFVSILFIYMFRKQLYDHHETSYLNFSKIFSRLIGINLVANFQFVLYKAKLSAYELERLNINLDNAKKILVSIEDKRFYKHKGVDARAIARGALSMFPFVRRRKGLIKSGGSTITMQLARSLFINAADYEKKFRRKFVEILLAFWLDGELSKKLIIGMYLGSVVFAEGVDGFVAAEKHFWGEIDKNPNLAKSFVLIERISNLSETYRPTRISYLVGKVIEDIGVDLNLEEVIKHYKEIGIASIENEA